MVCQRYIVGGELYSGARPRWVESRMGLCRYFDNYKKYWVWEIFSWLYTQATVQADSKNMGRDGFAIIGAVL